MGLEGKSALSELLIPKKVILAGAMWTLNIHNIIYGMHKMNIPTLQILNNVV